MLPITARAVDDVDETTYPLATWSRAVNYLGGCGIATPRPAAPLPVSVQVVGAANRDATIARIVRCLDHGASVPHAGVGPRRR
jgi:aspartyl-tRNA(Asn)/glutamyl-tRNA(Gln) amidotransferase subunit A